MFPDAEHTPAARAESARHEPVACFVRGKFPSPKCCIVAWFRRVLRAAVPETTINKHCDAQSGENEIGLAEHGPMSSPAGDAVRAEDSYQGKLRVLVPAPTDARHHIAALRFGEHIRHGILLTTDGHRCTQIQWPQKNAESAKMISTPLPGPLLVRGGEEKTLRSLRSFAAIESVCIGVHPWLKESRA